MDIEIIDTHAGNVREYGLCGYKDIKKAGYPEKLSWLDGRYKEGLKIKTLYSAKDGTQGMIEYIPGEYCWRPVEAKGYMFIHCIFCGFKNIYKNNGYGSLLLQECLKDAVKEGMRGAAIVTRKGPFMAGKELFLKNGFEVVDYAPPDFELCVKKFDGDAPSPKFKANLKDEAKKYGEGLKIIRAFQCPYTVKNINDMCRISEEEFGIKSEIIELKNCTEAQNSPCPFGIFCVLFNGKVVAHHPISGTRFANIIKKELGI